ncbi:MAG: alpha/beta hydrolase [Opitutaceae bacterium]|nr:alpha/beta hydrolase [Opitutaceae bacterium]
MKRLRALAFLAITAAAHAATPPAETFTFKRVGPLEIKADVWRPAAAHRGPRPVAVCLHGGSLINSGREKFATHPFTPAFLGAGWVVVSLDYRLAPESKLAAIVADVEDGFRWVREEGPRLFAADPARTVAVGSSAGGYLALVTGHRVSPRPLAIIAEMSYGDLIGEWQRRVSIHPPHHADSNLSEADAWRQVAGPPIANARERQGDGGAFNDFIRRTAAWPRAISGWDPRTEAERYEPYLPLRNVSASFPPTFLLHGAADTDVPPEQPRAMAAEFARHGVEHRLVLVPGAEHGFRGADPARVAAARHEAVAFALQQSERRAAPPTPSSAPRPVTFTYKQAGPLAIKADVHPVPHARGSRPVVVWIHGGALINGSRERDFRTEQGGWLWRLHERHGVVLVSIDYRLAPETPLPAVADDVADAMRWVREQGPRLFQADPAHIAAVGTSAGGYLALTTGHRVTPRPAAIVSFWGYGDLTGPWYAEPSPHERHRRVTPTAAEAWRQVSGPPIANARDRAGNGGLFYNYCRQHGLWPWAVSGWNPWREPENFFPFMPVKNVSRDFPPTLLVHGATDTDVPHEQSELMAAEFRRHGVPHRFVSVGAAEHGLAGAPPPAIENAYHEAGEFLVAHLVTRPAR